MKATKYVRLISFIVLALLDVLQYTTAMGNGFRFAAERERSSAGRARTKAQAETIGVRRLPENSSGVLKLLVKSQHDKSKFVYELEVEII